MTAFAVFAFVIFPILFFVYFRCTQKYVNPYKLIFIFGKKGSGKSTLLTKYALDYLKRGWNVYRKLSWYISYPSGRCWCCSVSSQVCYHRG